MPRSCWGVATDAQWQARICLINRSVLVCVSVCLWLKYDSYMKIFVIGTRGIPDIPGGVEKHCQELFPRIAAKGHDVLLCTRNFYVTKKINEWRGVKLINCFAPHNKSFEAIVHTFIALLKACFHNPDVVHIFMP